MYNNGAVALNVLAKRWSIIQKINYCLEHCLGYGV